MHGLTNKTMMLGGQHRVSSAIIAKAVNHEIQWDIFRIKDAA